MADTQFVGRRIELEELKRHTQKNIASFIVIKGRRRTSEGNYIRALFRNSEVLSGNCFQIELPPSSNFFSRS